MKTSQVKLFVTLIKVWLNNEVFLTLNTPCRLFHETKVCVGNKTFIKVLQIVGILKKINIWSLFENKS